MPVDLSSLANAPRVLFEVPLKPLVGSLFQPTGFPDLGAAQFDAPHADDDERKEYPRKKYPEGVPCLLVESAQSMANRLEAVCWSEADDDIAPELQGLPFVRVKLAGLGDGTDTTCSLLEFHRLNSPYIMQRPKDTARTNTAEGRWFAEVFRRELGVAVTAAPSEGGDDPEGGEVVGTINLRRLAAVCFKYDPNSLIHGLFLEKIAGRLRHPRALSAFIEARGVARADSGGVKFDRVLPKPSLVKLDAKEGSDKGAKLDAKEGYGNVPFSRSEFTARKIAAFFSLDLAQIRGYGLGGDASELLIALSLWKVRRLIETGLRLRASCDLEPSADPASITATRPDRFPLPPSDELTAHVRQLIARCKPLFADPAVTELTWSPLGKKATKPKK